MMRYFAVISWGAAATNWLAKTLNAHPGVLCLHAANEALSLHPGQPMRRDVEYMRMIARLGVDYAAVGDVHGFGAADVPALRAKYGKAFAVASMVRDPIPRLKSAVAMFRNQGWSNPIVQPARLTALIDGLYDVEALSPERQCVLHAMFQLNTVVNEAPLGPIYRMEDLTTDPEALLGLLQHLTGGRVGLSLAWAQEAVQANKTNAHVRSAPVDLDDWAMEALYKIVTIDAWTEYDKLGYPAPYFLLELAGRRGSPRPLVTAPI